MVLKLAGNLISGIPFKDYGHLQLVRDTGTQELEIEVQAPGSFLFGNWKYEPFGEDHTLSSNTPNYGDSKKYAVTTLNLGGRSEDDVWKVLGKIHAEFSSSKGENISYDTDQNSNSYINTLMYMIGIPLTPTLLAAATPTDTTDGFPGSDTNVVLNDVAIDNFVELRIAA